MSDPMPTSAAQATYCHLLWDSAFIDQRGDVFACCHSLPGAYGNVVSTHLGEIWARSQALAEQRAQSATGTLHCAPRCNILTAADKADSSADLGAPAHPRELWIQFGERCNLACIMCPQDHRSDLMLDTDALSRNVDWAQVQEVELQGGEYLAMRKAREFYEWLTGETSAKINMISNGLLIKPKLAERLVRHGNWIQVSINAASKATHELVNTGSTFEKALDGLRMLVAAKRAQGNGAEVVYKFTIVPENIAEIPQAVDLAGELGCDLIAFGFDRSVPAYLRARPQLKADLSKALAERMIGDVPVKMELKRLGMLGLLPAGDIPGRFDGKPGAAA